MNEMLELYGMNPSAIVVWRDSEDATHMGKIVGIKEEDDGCGHFLQLENVNKGIDNVPMSLVECFRNAPESEWIYEQKTDLDESELDRLALSF